MNFLLGLLLVLSLGHSKKLPEPNLYENSNQYIYGRLEGPVLPFEYGGSEYTAVLLHPHGTPSAFSQQITLCGDVSKMFPEDYGPSDEIILTYSRYYTKNLCYTFSDVRKVGK